ncbi:MAG: peptidylprolyl isomerase [Bacteroidia bacterium]|nr:peptidylprolyl isomerase [Bacteroidia bacterium]
MAILGKIRERSLFLIIIIALALFSFVIGDVFTRGGFGGSSNSVGEINGDNITREEFAELVEQQRARSGNRASQMQSVNAAWDNLVRQKIYENQLEKSGVIVGEKDVWDEIINQPFVQSSPQFKNEAGLFDEEKFKEYIATLKDAKDDDEQGQAAWLSWLDYERNIKSSLELRTYNNLITAGLGVTLKESERYYFENNTKLDLEYVFVPYIYISDSTITVSDDEIKQYVKKHPEDFRAEATRDISFVKFDIKATPEDENAIKNEMSKLINDREEYSTAAKNTIKIKGFSNSNNPQEFFRDNSSDTPFDDKFYTKSKLNQQFADSIFNLNVGEIFGPYKEGEFFKLSKLIEVKQLPDSVKARHILIPFLGALRASPSVTQTDEQAKNTADSLLTIFKKDKSKFADLAKDFSSDTGSGAKGGDLGWFDYNRMVPQFRDFTFENKIGDIDVVKSDFGYHIIDIQDQKNIQKAVKIATFSRKIEPSEETENDIFQKAETFASELSTGKDMAELAKENNLTVIPVLNLKAMDEQVSSLGNQRQIVNWAFNKSTKEKEIKRFDIDNGYAVVMLNTKRKKGLSIGQSKFNVRSILLNEKKGNIIKDKMKGDNLQEIANSFNSEVKSSKAVSLGSPLLPDAGRSPELITTLLSLPENKVYTKIETPRGIFAVKIIKKEVPKSLDNYSSIKPLIENKVKAKGGQAYDVLKKAADIEDNRATIY